MLPLAPFSPTKPVKPVDPVDPVEPTSPGSPVIPRSPITPGNPVLLYTHIQALSHNITDNIIGWRVKAGIHSTTVHIRYYVILDVFMLS